MTKPTLKLSLATLLLLCGSFAVSFGADSLANGLAAKTESKATSKSFDAENAAKDLFNSSNSTEKKKLLKEVVETVNDNDPLALALKNIELTMGEHGFELWRLKAQWASMREADGSIEVIQPRVIYSMDAHKEHSASSSSQDEQVKQDKFSSTPATHASTPSGKLPQEPDESHENIILVTADKGLVRQKDKVITLEGNVTAVSGMKRLSGPKMRYDGDSRSIVFSEGMNFSGEGVSGQAAQGSWDLNSNVISAQGGVHLIYNPTPLNEPSGDKKH